MFHRSLP